MGRYPVEAVATLGRIASATEPHRERENLWRRLESLQGETDFSLTDLLSLGVEAVIENTRAAAVVVPTRSGKTARGITRFRLPMWILAATENPATARNLAFSYGVHAHLLQETVTDWNRYARQRLASLQLEGDLALLLQGPSASRPDANHSMEILHLRHGAAGDTTRSDGGTSESPA
jgi:pyruvate kinase